MIIQKIILIEKQKFKKIKQYKSFNQNDKNKSSNTDSS